MTVRTGMTGIIATLRNMSQAGTADFAIGAINYWSDDQLQSILDTRRTDFTMTATRMESEYSGGTLIYKRYYLPYANIESGTALKLQNSAGVEFGTATYSVDYNAGLVTFASDTGGSAVYATGRSFDLNRSAADVWRRKAAYYGTKPDFSTDNHSVKFSAIAATCISMAAQFDAAAGASVVSVYRDDNYPGR